MERKSWTPTFRKAVIERYGTKCYVCGEDAEYHHLIPLWLGGEDILENIIPLCHVHHLAIHDACAKKWSRSRTGRPRANVNVSGYKYILHDYYSCRIGTAKCKEALGLAKGTHISDRKWAREYMDELGITAYRNNIDILKANGKPRSGIPVGWAEFKDGHKETYYWDDVREQ